MNITIPGTIEEPGLDTGKVGTLEAPSGGAENVSRTITIVESLTRTRLRWALMIAFCVGLVTIPLLDVFVAWLCGLLHV
jgi:hypothetical protein